MLRIITSSPTQRCIVTGRSLYHGRNNLLAALSESASRLALQLEVPRGSSTSSMNAAEEKVFEDYQRYVGSLSPARQKFLGVLDEYRANNFEHATPSRFFKMIVNAVDSNHDGVITTEEYQTLLRNIGAQHKMTDEDLKEIFEDGDGELGDEKVITVEGLEKRWTPFLHVMWRK